MKSDNEKRELLVRDRLEFVSIISSLNPQFLNPKLIRNSPYAEHGWTHPWLYFDSLRNYLLLTCFDLLGQPHSFKDFQSWLSTISNNEDRISYLLKRTKGMDFIETIKAVHQEYLAAYGTRNSFYRFIQEVLPRSIQEKLFYSIRITEVDPIKNLEINRIEDEEKKKAFLFRMRNSFTHAGEHIGSPVGGVFEEYDKWIVINGIPKKGWGPIYSELKNGIRINYSVRDWPNVLIQTVEAGLSHIAEANQLPR